MSLLLEKKLYIFILALPLLTISLFGNHETPIKQLFYDFNLNEIITVFNTKDNIFRPPDTILRFSIFVISFIILLASFFLKSRNIDSIPKFIPQLIVVLISLFFITILITDTIYNITAIILLSLCIFYSLYYARKSYNKYEIILLATYILFFIYPFYNSLIHLSSLSELDNYLRLLFVIPIYVTLREINLKLHDLLIIFGLSSISSGLFAIYQYYFMNGPIVGFSSSTSVFASIILFFSLISFMSISQFSNKNIRSFFIVSFFIGFIGWMLTGQRGLSLIIILFIFYLLLTKSKTAIIMEKKSLGFASLILLSLLFVSPVFDRMTNTYHSTYNYLFEGSGHYWQHEDSIVPRISIWKASINMINENNLYGVGLNNFNEKLEDQITRGNVDPIRKTLTNKSAGMNHAHNQYLDIYAKTGIFGLITLLIFIYFHIKFFSRELNREKSDHNFISLLGILSVCYFSIIMLFQTFLAHQQLMLFMSVILSILAAIKTSMHMRSNTT